MIPPAVLDAADSASAATGPDQDADDADEVSPDAETTPMAVILGDQPQDHQPAAEPPGADGDAVLPSVKRVRGPFEPPEKSDPVENGSPSPVRTSNAGAGGAASQTTMSDAARASVWSPAAAKMDQIKDLYLTAEAIGEDALEQNFDLVSDRQRQLIREYFSKAGERRTDSHDAVS